MKSIFCRMAVLGFLYPYIVGFAPDSSNNSTTSFEFAVGHGSYAKVTRDCSGNIVSVEDIPYTDGGISVDHQFSAFRVGAKAGVASVSNEQGSLQYVNPNIGVNTKYFGLDVGAFAAGNKNIFRIGFIPSGALRIGNRESWYFTTAVANNLPVFTGGGMVDLGLGFNLGKPHSNLWIGVGIIPPIQSPAFSVKADIPYTNDFLITLRGHAASKVSFEYGLSLGGKFILQ